MPKAKNVTVIPATLNIHTKTPTAERVRRRVAAYARVSTDSEEQLTSYVNQKKFYTGITKLISVFGDQLNDEIFKEKVGAISVKQLVRTAKERHAGSMGYAQAMLIEYNGKKKNPAQRLSMNKLHARESSIFSGLSDLEEQEDSADEEDDNLFDELD